MEGRLIIQASACVVGAMLLAILLRVIQRCHSVACDTEVPVEEGMMEELAAARAFMRRWRERMGDDPPDDETLALIEAGYKITEIMHTVVQGHAEIAALFPVAMVGED